MLVNTFAGQSLDGVYTRMLPSPIAPNTNVATGTCVLVCTTDWGPEGQVVATGRDVDWVSAFGTYSTNGTNETSGYAQAMGYFRGGKKNRISGGGSDLRTIRIAGSSKAKASRTFFDNATVPGQVGIYTAKYNGNAGNNIQAVIADGSAKLNAPAAPTAVAGTTGGSIATGNVFFAITETTNRGETTPTAGAASVAVTGPNGKLTVTFPTAQAAGKGFNVYAGSSATALYRVNGNTPITAATYDVLALPSASNAALPTANTAATTFDLSIVPFDGSAPESFTGLTPATAPNIVSKWGSWAAPQSNASSLLPTPGTYFLTGGDSGLAVTDSDYVGVPGFGATGWELAKTVSGANYLICGKMSAAIKAQMKSVGDLLFAAPIVGPDTNQITPDQAIAEQQLINDWAVAYAYGYQDWLNPISGVTQSILPAGSIAGARCNGEYWVSITQLTLNGYLGPTTPLSELDAGRLEKAGIIAITAGSVCRDGVNTSQDVTINQMEDFQIPVTVARMVDQTARPLIGEPQVFDPTTNASPFFDVLKAALEDTLRLQPKEAIQSFYVVAAYDPTLASVNKARAQVVFRQTGKANQILIDVSGGRTQISVVPQGVTLLTGS